MLGLGADDCDVLHTNVRSLTFLRLAEVFNNRGNRSNQEILNRWTDNINWTEQQQRPDGTMANVRFSYGNMENYIRTMMHPATEGPDNYYHWGNLTDLYPAAAAIGRTVIVLYRYGPPGHEVWAYQVSDAQFDFTTIYHPDVHHAAYEMEQQVYLKYINVSKLSDL